MEKTTNGENPKGLEYQGSRATKGDEWADEALKRIASGFFLGFFSGYGASVSFQCVLAACWSRCVRFRFCVCRRAAEWRLDWGWMAFEHEVVEVPAEVIIGDGFVFFVDWRR